MNEKNNDLLHLFMFGICALVLVCCGEQVKTHTTGVSSWLMRISAIFSTFTVIFLAVSFIPANLSNRCCGHKDEYRKKIVSLYSYKGIELIELQKETVEKIEEDAIQMGYWADKQDMYDKWNKLCTYIAGCSVVAAVVLFMMGVCFL